MVRVMVMGDHDLAMAPVRHALAGVAGVEMVGCPAPTRTPAVDTIVIDQSMGPKRATEGMRALADQYPGASLLVIELQGGDEYRWVHIQPHGAVFRVYDAGTGPLSGILATSLATARPGHDAARHATAPAIPCSTA